MKLLVVVALFAFVAVKLSQAAPVPDEEKKMEAIPVSVAAAEVSSTAATVVEVKSDAPISETPVSAPAHSDATVTGA